MSINLKTNETKNDIINQENICLRNIERILTSKFFNTSDLDNGNEMLIENNNILITLTTSYIQKNSMNSNMTSINLGDCEIELRKYYNISINNTLYIKKLDVKQIGYKIPKIVFDVYCKLNDSNLIKLDLTICSNTNMDIYIPLEIIK